MFCPKCSHQQATDTVRFCSRCGFQLDIVKELLEAEEKGDTTVSLKDARGASLRQVDILIGAAFMLIGAIKAGLFIANISWPRWEGIIFALFTLSIGFASFLLFSQLSHRQRGLTLGATLMFVGALVALPAIEFFGLPGLILLALILFPVIIFWTRLTGLFMKVFFGKEVLPEKAAPVLIEPPAASISIDPSPQRPARMKTSDLAQPPSITEETTSLLEKS